MKIYFLSVQSLLAMVLFGCGGCSNDKYDDQSAYDDVVHIYYWHSGKNEPRKMPDNIPDKFRVDAKIEYYYRDMSEDIQKLLDNRQNLSDNAKERIADIKLKIIQNIDAWHPTETKNTKLMTGEQRRARSRLASELEDMVYFLPGGQKAKKRFEELGEQGRLTAPRL